MKAAVYDRYGPPDVVRIDEVPTPVPKEDEVLVRVHATTVSSADRRLRAFDLPSGFAAPGRLVIGVTGPRKRILGTELSGTVAAVGSAVTRFGIGDSVVAFPGARLGSHAEYRTIRETGLVIPKPASLTFEQAAAMSFGGTTALCFLRDRARLKRGETVLVIGAAGAVGSAAVQIAVAMGGIVTGTASALNGGLLREIGAVRAIDYAATDILADAARYDVVIDTVGLTDFASAKHILNPGGRLVLVAAGLWPTLRSLLPHPGAGGRRSIAGPAAEDPLDLVELARMADSGQFRPIMETVYPFDRIADAHAHVDSHHKRGSVVVSLVD